MNQEASLPWHEVAHRNNYEVDFIEMHNEKIKALEIKKTMGDRNS